MKTEKNNWEIVTPGEYVSGPGVKRTAKHISLVGIAIEFNVLCKTIIKNIQSGCFYRPRLSGMENINIVSSLNIVQSLCFWGKNCVFSLKLLIYHVLELFRQGKISLYLVNRIYTKNVTGLLKYKENGFPEVLALIVYQRQQKRKYCKRVH